MVVEYEYGLPHLVGDVSTIALRELLERLTTDRRDVGATSATDDFGTYNWEPQNNGRPSRVPAVNAWLLANDVRVMLAGA